jgi:hypothetical protein
MNIVGNVSGGSQLNGYQNVMPHTLPQARVIRAGRTPDRRPG